jgi:hypothetical protein
MVSSLKLKAEEEKTTGTWFVPSDRVCSFLYISLTIQMCARRQRAADTPQVPAHQMLLHLELELL